MKGKVVVEDGDIAFDECRNRNLVKEVSCTGARDFRYAVARSAQQQQAMGWFDPEYDHYMPFAQSLP